METVTSYTKNGTPNEKWVDGVRFVRMLWGVTPDGVDELSKWEIPMEDRPSNPKLWSQCDYCHRWSWNDMLSEAAMIEMNKEAGSNVFKQATGSKRTSYLAWWFVDAGQFCDKCENE